MAISSSVSWSSRKNGSSQSNGLASAAMPRAALFIGVAVAMAAPVASFGASYQAAPAPPTGLDAGVRSVPARQGPEDLQAELPEGLGGSQFDGARTGQVDPQVGCDAAGAGRHDHHAIGQEDGLGDRMGHEQDRL